MRRVQWRKGTSMRLYSMLASSALWAATAMGAHTAPVTIGGSGGPTTVLAPVVEAFERAHPSIRVALQPSLGSRGGIRAVAQGALDIGVASRELRPDDGNLVGIEFGRSPLVLAVSSASPDKSVTLQQLADMYGGRAATWSDGRRVRVVLRPSSDADTVALRGLSPAMHEASVAADARAGMVMAMTDLDSTEYIESISGAIGTTTLAQLSVEKRRLRALALDGIEPTIENARAGRYVPSKRFLLVARPPLRAPAQAFVDFVRGAEGRAILERHGVWAAGPPR